MKKKMLTLMALVAFLWAVEIMDAATLHRLDFYGALRPRTEWGLAQIFSAPFLHANWQHLISNTTALLPLGALMLLEGSFWPVTLISIVVGGLGCWLFGTGASLGYSVVLFGYGGFLMVRGLYQRKPLLIGLSLLSISWFGGSVLGGLVPQSQISWAGHFWGLVGGILAARSLPARRYR